MNTEQLIDFIAECLDHDLNEGINDKHIFKAFFLAGGPGSGKSFVSKKALGGEGLKVVNSDDIFEHFLKKAGLSMKMPDDEASERDKHRDHAKTLTAKRQMNYIEGRLGLIIDGTGKDFNKIKKQSEALKNLGYDTHMIFVDTSLDVAKQRNTKRARSVPEDIVTKGWNDVQSNKTNFKNYFSKNFIALNNDKFDQEIMLKVVKEVKKLLAKPVDNPIAKKWMDQARSR